jgi:hypothetical protein
MQYNFPPTKFVQRNTIKQQIEHIKSEFEEFITEVEAGNMDLADREVMDLYHSLETYFRIREKQGVDIKKVRRDTWYKNWWRGYYDESGKVVFDN